MPGNEGSVRASRANARRELRCGIADRGPRRLTGVSHRLVMPPARWAAPPGSRVGGCSLVRSQNRPVRSTASANSWVLTGFRTWALASLL